MNTILLASAALLFAEPFTMERVVAVVGSEPVLHSDVITLMIESGIDPERAVSSSGETAAYRESMEQVIREKLLVEAARREGVYPTRDEIQQAVDGSMAEAREGFRSEQEFINYIASMGLTVRALRDSYETILGDRLAGENFVRLRSGRVMSSLPMDPVSWFTLHPEAVEDVLAPRTLSWIYIPVLPGATEEAEALLSDVREWIEGGEITFSSAAATYSEDGSASSGGDLGWFGRGDMTSTFEDQVYSLDPGEIAGPFRTPFGVHLVKVSDMTEDSVRASHILRTVQLTPADLDSALALAHRTLSEIQEGAGFADVARRVSRDPRTAAEGGFIGTVNVGSWEGELRSEVISLLPGEVSAPVEIEQSMAVAIFTRNDSGGINWDEFEQDELDLMLQSVFWNTHYESMVDSLRNTIPVLVNISHED